MSEFPQTRPLSLRAALEHVADALTAAGVPTVLDPADLSVPGAVVYPATVDYDVLGRDCYDLTVDLVLVAGDVPPPAALDQLDTLLIAARGVWPVDVANAAGVRLPNQSPDPLPALTARVTVSVAPDAP